MPSLEVELEQLKAEEPAYYKKFAQKYSCFTGDCRLIDHFSEKQLLKIYEQSLAGGKLGKNAPPKAICQLKLTEDQFAVLQGMYDMRDMDDEFLWIEHEWEKAHELNIEDWEAVTELDQKEYNSVLRVLGVELGEDSEAEEFFDCHEEMMDEAPPSTALGSASPERVNATEFAAMKERLKFVDIEAQKMIEEAKKALEELEKDFDWLEEELQQH